MRLSRYRRFALWVAVVLSSYCVARGVANLGQELDWFEDSTVSVVHGAAIVFLAIAAFCIVFPVVQVRAVRVGFLVTIVFLFLNSALDVVDDFGLIGSWLEAPAGRALTRLFEDVAMSGFCVAFFFGARALGETRRELAREVNSLLAERRERTRVESRLQQNEMVLAALVDGTCAVVGRPFFDSLVRNIAESLDVSYAVVAKCLDSPPTQMRTLAFWQEGRLGDAFEYSLDGVPCGLVIEGKSVFIPSGVQSQYPSFPTFLELGVEAYCGLPLLSSSGKVLGSLAILSRRPLTQDLTQLPPIRIFASRAAAELERIDQEENQKKLEVRMLRMQKMESLEVLSAGVAHDFNNLLTAILSCSNVVRRELDPDSPSATHVQRIEMASTRAAELCDELLAYAGQRQIDAVPVLVSDLVEEAAELLEVGLSKKTKVHFELDRDLKPIDADPAQLRQVIFNLMTNASEALPDREGVITLRTGTVQADAEYLASAVLEEDLPPGEYVYVEVSDNGAGMDEKTKGRLFDPFFSTKFQGRGLGLAAVLGIVRSNNGAVLVESQSGLGTIFRILFPASSRPLSKPASLPTARDLPAIAGTVLVVDDEELVAAAVQTVLERSGCRVLIARDGYEAAETFGQNPQAVDLILLDMKMPRMDGPEAFAKLREIRANVPIILTSGFSDTEVVGRLCDGSEAVVFLQKPFGPSELVSEVRTLLS